MARLVQEGRGGEAGYLPFSILVYIIYVIRHYARMLDSAYPPKSFDDLKKQASAIPEDAQPAIALIPDRGDGCRTPGQPMS